MSSANRQVHLVVVVVVIIIIIIIIIIIEYVNNLMRQLHTSKKNA